MFECPICKTINDDEAPFCVNCGQRFKPIEIDDVDDEEIYTYKKKSRVKIIIIRIIAAMVVILYMTTYYQSELISLINQVIPRTISSVVNENITINQHDDFSLPKTLIAKMSYGPDTGANVNWYPNSIDTSVPGIRTFQGHISGYDKTVSLVVKILPHKVMEQINNCYVSNSVVELSVNAPYGVKWVWFQIAKGKKVKNQIVKVNNGIINAKVYLPFNQGKYAITVRTNSKANQNGLYYGWKDFNAFNTDKRNLQYLMPDTYIQSDSPEIKGLADYIIAGKISIMDKALAIHDWVASNISYDADAYFNHQVHEYSAIETLNGRKAVCNGYANLTAAINRAAGIRTKIISGLAWSSGSLIYNKPAGHAWNEFYADGKWIIEDTTWDAGGIEQSTRKFVPQLSHKYFNPDYQVFSDDHKKLSESQ